jgi:hypothetical protein
VQRVASRHGASSGDAHWGGTSRPAAGKAKKSKSTQPHRRDPIVRSDGREARRHAELSWEVARWLDTKLDADARARVRQARDRAVESLRAELSGEVDSALVDRLGIPSAARTSVVIDDLRRSLWS